MSSFDDDSSYLNINKSNNTKRPSMSNVLMASNSFEEDTIENSPGKNSDLPFRTRKAGVWSDDGSKSSRNKTSNIIEQERFQVETKQESEDDDIPVIPDIDDLTDDLLNLPDVKIPAIAVEKSTYKELDNKLENIQVQTPNVGNIEDIDLSFLTKKLYPEKEVKNVDEVWTMESLYTELFSSQS